MSGRSCYSSAVVDLPHDWSGGIDALVETANRLLPELLPVERFGRQKEEINARLVRHYTTTGHLPPAGRRGREAQYFRHHLLALLALRRLMAEGISGAMLHGLVAGQDEDTLEQVALRGFNGGAEVTRQQLVAENPHRAVSRAARQLSGDAGVEGQQRALEYLKGLRTPEPMVVGAVLGRPLANRNRPSRTRGSTGQVEQVRRVRLLPGVEVLIGAEASWPASESGWAEVMQVLEASLRDVAGQ